jgi:aminoglycoside phosphotransferase (APT) family kinase protein
MTLPPTEIMGLTRLVHSVFGSACRLGEARVALRRRDYLVALLTLDNPPHTVAVKLAGPTAPLACPFDRTAAILRLVREQTAVPVPTVLACDVSYRDWPWRFLLTTALPGIRWSEACRHWTPTDRRDTWAQLGETVAALHSLRFPACGEIGPDGAVLSGEPYRAALAARARRRIADQRHMAIFLAVLDERADAFAATTGACLAHEDLNPTNLLVGRDESTGRWQLTGILDFDSAWAGNAESDLARLALWSGMTGDEFWSSYGLTRPLTADEQTRHLVLQLLWCLEYAQPTDRHHADTRRICAALDIAPITFDRGQIRQIPE